MTAKTDPNIFLILILFIYIYIYKVFMNEIVFTYYLI
jgi:hypothetical protein